MLRLLLIDDNPDQRLLVSRELRRGFPNLQIVEVGEAESLNSALKREIFDIAITDYCLGWNDGLTVLSELKSRLPNCPVIMFTNSGDQEIAVEAMKAGLDDYIIKTAKNYDRLRVAVRTALKRAEERMQLRRAEAALDSSEQRFRLLVESVKDYAIFILDSNGYITSWNSGAEQILGYQEAEIIGQHFKCIFTPEDRDRGIPQQELSAATIEGRATDERWHLRKNGSLFWASGIVTPLRDESENLLGFAKILRDMTEPKQAEEALQQLNENLESLVQERTSQLQKALQYEGTLKRITEKLRDSLDESQILQTAVQELALVLNVTCCNTAMYDLEKGTAQINYEYATANGGAQARTISLAAFPEVYQQLLQRQYCQFCSLTPNPIRGRVAMLAMPIFDDRWILGDLWAILMPNYTFNELEIGLVQQVAAACAIAIRQARLYKAAKAQVEELEKLNALKDDFLNTVSHELRTPMASIKLAVSMLEINLRQAGWLDVESNRAAQYLQILHHECDREIRLIGNLLDLSRLEAGDAPSDLTTLDLKNWIPSIVESFSERARSQQQSLLFDIPPDLPAVTTSAAQLERVLTELLHNACKYTPSGEQISIGATAQPDKLRLQVSNSGVEIPATELVRIFEKFYRIPNNDPWKHGGTGLGLALVKKLVEHLGGEIEATASNGWTNFTVELPI